MKKVLISFVLTFASLFGQPQNNFPSIIPIVPFETEVISFPDSQGSFNVIYTYKIPYRLLVFERQNGSFIASFRIIVEVLDKDGKLIERDIKDNKITVENFDASNNPNLVLQDYLTFQLKPDEYKIAATISDRNSTGERPLKPIDLQLSEKADRIVLHPIIIKSENNKCGENLSSMLANSGGNIPFSMNNFNLIIPVTDTSITKLEITVENNSKLVITDTLTDSFLQSLDLTKCEDNLYLTSSDANLTTRNFTIENINEKLDEGEVVITLKNEEKKIEEEIFLKVIWFGKPFSLFDSENAIELLIAIESESIVDSLLAEDESDYPIVLKNYFDRFDPSPETSFNEIMFEYYSRVDFAIREFSSITNNNGAKSDRGLVYIKYGNPETIDRTSNTQGEVIEIWKYSASQRTFTFIDKIGTGNFKLTDNR